MGCAGGPHVVYSSVSGVRPGPRGADPARRRRPVKRISLEATVDPPPGSRDRRPASLGYRNLYIMPAGIVGWIKAGQPVVKGNQSGG